jgi:hypothetical protein
MLPARLFVESLIKELKRGVGVGGATLFASGLSRGRFREETNLVVSLRLEGSSSRLLFLKVFHGRGAQYKPWVEVFGVKPIVVVGGRSLAYYGSEVEKTLYSLIAKNTPPGGSLYVEYYDATTGYTYARQAGTYPLVAEIPCRLEKPLVVDVLVYAHSARSVRAVPLPLDANRTPYSLLAKVFGSTVAARIIGGRPYPSDKAIVERLGERFRGLLSVKGFACEK